MPKFIVSCFRYTVASFLNSALGSQSFHAKVREIVGFKFGRIRALIQLVFFLKIPL